MNGTEWFVQLTRNPGTTENFLGGVSCSSAEACITVGTDQNSASTYVSLAEHWNALEWTTQSTPNPTGAKGLSRKGYVDLR